MTPRSMSTTGYRVTATRRGILCAATAASWLFAGLMAKSTVVLCLGACMAAWFLTGIGMTRAAQRHYARANWRILQVHEPACTLRSTVGSSILLPFELRLPSNRNLRLIRIDAQTAGHLDAALEQDEVFSLRLTPHRIGDAYLLGAIVHGESYMGLFNLSFWCPARLRVQALPRLFTGRQGLGARTARVAARTHATAMAARRKGFGLELRELRDYQSGDAFKNIAWRATAKRGKIISREFESDLSVSAWIALDVSPSMFWGAPGHARIDYAMETTYGLVSMMSGLGQSCGLSLFDNDLRLMVPSGTGKTQLRRVSNALLEVSSLFHEGRTEMSNMELVHAVARWFQAQENMDFQLTDTDYRDASSLDLARLASAARRKTHEYIESEHDGRLVVPVGDYARDPNQAMFRAFARYAGLNLPLDPSPMPGGQSIGLAATLERILHEPGGPHTVIVISDLQTVEDVSVIRRAALALRRKKHRVVIFCPSHPTFDRGEEPASVLHAALDHTSAIATHQRLRLARAALHPAGVSFLHCGPNDVLGRLLDRLRRAA